MSKTDTEPKIEEKTEGLLEQSITVLAANDRGDFTVPAHGLYPHQWLWDSCFIAIGMRHYDIERAQTEIVSLLRGQWSNGMLPNMILTYSKSSKHKPEMWRSQISPFAPDNVPTSGITQPPMIAEAVVKIGEKLPADERRRWYQKVYPAILAYHEWMYNERDPHSEGLVLQIHPWETGLDNTPPWMYELHQHLLPFWIRAVRATKLDHIITLLRSDRRYALPGERLSTIDGLALYSVQRRLRRKGYDIHKILTHSMLTIEDLTFNCILIRANSCLRTIAKAIDKEIPESLAASMKKTKNALDQLWDAYTGEYYSRNFITHKLIKVPTIATLMPLYAGSLTDERAEHIVKLLTNQHMFAAKHPVPTVPVNSEWFKQHMYWQGPTWVNTNWLLIEGLERCGFEKEADELRQKTINLVKEHGFNEYFSPLDGKPAGVENFSWTAALTIDLLKK